jgi:hypothetical protein
VLVNIALENSYESMFLNDVLMLLFIELLILLVMYCPFF